jgi:hypothetical protein
MAASATSQDAPVLLTNELTESTTLAADPTGVYWYDDSRATSGTAFIRKYTPATSQVTDVATVQAVQFLRTNGTHVAWADAPSMSGATKVWSSTSDQSQVVELGVTGLVRQLALDESFAYLAESPSGDDYSDIFAIPISGGPPMPIACHVFGVYSMAVDDNDVYFSTWDTVGTLSKVPKRAP